MGKSQVHGLVERRDARSPDNGNIHGPLLAYSVEKLPF